MSLRTFCKLWGFVEQFPPPEERVLGLVDLVVVHAQDLLVHSGDRLDQPFVAGRQLELSEEAGAHAASGGAAESDLAG